MWAVSIGTHLTQVFTENWVFSRPLFYPLLSIPALIVEQPWSQFMVARAIMLLNTLVLFWAMHKVCRTLRFSFEVFVLGSIFLLANTGFLNQGFRLRSDLLAATLAMISFVLVIQKKSPFFSFLPLLASPKALIHVVALFLPQFFKKKIYRKKTFWAFVMGVAIFMALPVGTQLLLNQWEYFKNALSGQTGSPPYFSSSSFVYVMRQMQNNSWFWLLILLKIGFYVFRFRKLSDEEKYLGYVALLSGFFLFSFPEKIPFFIASLLPILALWIASLWNDFRIVFQTHYLRISFATTMFVPLLLVPGFSWYTKNRDDNGNQDQRQAVIWLESYLKGLNTHSYYDVVGQIPSWAHVDHFIGPHQPLANQSAFEGIRRQKPHVILYTNKLNFLRPELDQFLESEYIELKQGVYLRSLSLSDLKPNAQIIAIESLFARPNDFSYEVKPETDPFLLIEIWARPKGQKGVLVRRWSEIKSLLTSNDKNASDLALLKVSPFLPPAVFLEKRFDELIRFDSDF